MRLRLGLMAGFAAGYVMGAKAGQERYEEIRRQFNDLMGTEQAQQLQAQMREVASRAGEVIEEKTSGGMSRVSEKVGSRSGGGRSGTGTTGTTGGTGTNGTTAGDAGIVLPPT